MKTLAIVLTLGAMLAGLTPADAGNTTHSVSLRDAIVRSDAGGEVRLKGSGTYDPGSGLLLVSGTFRCVGDVTQGPLAGCRGGERGRWEGANVLPSLSFPHTGAAGEAPGLAATDASTLAMQAEFWRDSADGGAAPLRAKLILSANDLDPDQPGVQNVWIEGVGCAAAAVVIR